MHWTKLENQLQFKTCNMDALQNPHADKYYGLTRGVVVQNNDPQRRGCVKILTQASYPNMYGLFADKPAPQNESVIVNFPATAGGGSINREQFEEIKKKLPWAEQASPLIGPGSAGTLQHNNDASTSSGQFNDAKYGDAGSSSDIKTNADDVGQKTSSILAKQNPDSEYQVVDYFETAQGARGQPIRKVNAFGRMYYPNTHGNSTGGTMSVPNVGSHVWCSFEGGDMQRPVYFAFSYGAADWSSVSTDYGLTPGVDYPGAYENNEAEDVDKIKRGGCTFASPGGSISISDTDHFRKVNITHHGGSFLEFNNDVTSMFSNTHQQVLINGDQYESVNFAKNTGVKKDYNLYVDETHYLRVGLGSGVAGALKEWKDKYAPTAYARAGFSTQRVTPPETSDSLAPGTSNKKAQGTAAAYPALASNPTALNYGAATPPGPLVVNNSSNNVTNNSYVAGAAAAAAGAKPEPVELTPETIVNAAGANGSGNYSGNGESSPSSQGGNWEPNDAYSNAANMEKNIATDLAKIEKKLGMGGDYIVEVTRHKIEVIGQSFNNFPGVRIDDAGRASQNELLISSGASFGGYKQHKHVEPVQSAFPCGNYNLTIGNQFSVTVGSGGINMQTTGQCNIGGAMVTVAGAHQTVIGSGGDLKLTAAGALEISADVLTLRQSNNKQVFIGGSMGVKNNLIIGGGAHIEGELFVNHITAPLEMQQTQLTTCFGQLVAGTIIGKDSQGGNVVAVATPNAVQLYDHSHVFVNVPLTLVGNPAAVRSAAAGLNKGDTPASASAPTHGSKA